MKDHNAIIAMPSTIAQEVPAQIERPEMIVAVLGATLLETPVPEVAKHCSAQLYPSGQQLPPLFAGQLYQALGHDPPCGGAVVAMLAPLGASTVTPFVATTVAVGFSIQEPVV
jgi:hypothetical protein